MPETWLRELLYPANLLTIVRLALVPVIARELQAMSTQRAACALAAAFFTDVIDGPIARARGEVSEMGKILDPISDKALLNVTAHFLVGRYGLPRWVAILLLVRDLAIVAGSTAIFQRSNRIEMSQPVGKFTTVAFGAGFLLHIAAGERWSRPVLALAALLLAASTVFYGKTLIGSLSMRSAN
ncbi:MAG TPA: CDP-alcohol phosphatidyltransferase family protein [Roseiflexaceae bacterium]|nr:CDP-alcohol phosphatidyltransferase family protein [Roseiflexaceae bacterium]